MKLGKKFIGAGAIAKVSVISLLVITTFIYGIQNGFEPFDTSKLVPTLGGFIAIAPVILFSYVGFEAPNAASDEMFDAKRDTAPAIRRGSITATLAYLLPVLAIILIVPANEVEGLTGFMGAIKEAGPDLSQTIDLLKDRPKDFLVVSGDDEIVMAQIACGMDGVISVAANAFPKPFSDMVEITPLGL